VLIWDTTEIEDETEEDEPEDEHDLEHGADQLDLAEYPYQKDIGGEGQNWVGSQQSVPCRLEL